MKKKFYPAFHGLIDAFQHPSVLLQGILGICAIIAGIILHLTQIEWIIVIIMIGLVITVEMLNTCIELICDYLTTERNEKIRLIKDISAAAVLVSGITAFVVACIILGSHLG